MSTIKVNTLDTTSGTAITVATGKTLTVGGKSVTAGSSNIQRATSDVTVATTADYDVAGKSELVIAANAGGATRTITLCPVAETGADTCIITVVADANATSTYKLTVVESDGSTEVWTGYQTGDFVRLIVSNSAWLVVDHKETYYSRRYLTANQTVAATVSTKIITWTNVSEIGNTWDNTNNKLVTPTGMNGYWTINYNMAGDGNNFQVGPYLVIGGTTVIKFNVYGHSGQGYMGRGSTSIGGYYHATSAQAVEFYGSNYQTSSYSEGSHVAGGNLSETHFTAQFNRIY